MLNLIKVLFIDLKFQNFRKLGNKLFIKYLQDMHKYVKKSNQKQIFENINMYKLL